MAKYVDENGLKEVLRLINQDFAKKTLVKVAISGASGDLSQDDYAKVVNNLGLVVLVHDGANFRLFEEVDGDSGNYTFVGVAKDGAWFGRIILQKAIHNVNLNNHAWQFFKVENSTAEGLEALKQAFLDGTYTVKKAERDANGNVINLVYETKNDANAKKAEVEAQVDELESKIVNGGIIAKYASHDVHNNPIYTTYATKGEVTNEANTRHNADQEIISNVINGTYIAGKAHRDGDGNVIKDIYATKTELLNEGIVRRDNDNALGTRIDNEASTRASAITTETNARVAGDEAIRDDIDDGTLVAEKARKDASGNTITSTYETKSDATTKQTTLQSAINSEASARSSADTSIRTDVGNGTLVAKKAEQDASGNIITNTYATKVELSSEATSRTQGDNNLQAQLDTFIFTDVVVE